MQLYFVRELLTHADRSELALLESTLHAGYCEENYLCWRVCEKLVYTIGDVICVASMGTMSFYPG